MRVGMYSDPHWGPAVGLFESGKVYGLARTLSRLGLPWNDLGGLLAAEGPYLASVRQVWARVAENAPWDDFVSPVAQVRLLPPIPRPGKILCVVGNYKAHIEESKVLTYAPKDQVVPWFFLKPPTSLNPHGAPICLPKLSGKVDWELELGVVIGRRGRRIPVERAFDFVAGYLIINDVSAREITFAERRVVRDRDKFHDWLYGKWFDTFCCVGPWLTTVDEVGAGDDLRLRLSVNGTVYQDGNTADMIFSVAELVSFISRITTLEPGDLIATGTPSGVGKASGRFLRPGDIVRGEIERVGVLENPVVGDGEKGE